MKTKIPNKSYFLLKGKIENKNEFNKRTLKKVKQSKEWKSKLKYKNKNKILIEMWNWKEKSI